MAHHVGVLQAAGLIRVVRAKRVRAMEERYYGRTARMFHVGVGSGGGGTPLALDFNDFDVAARESQHAYQDHRLWSFIRHARIPPERADEFWARARALVQEFDRLPRSGDETFGFVLGIYPVPDYPLLPDPDSQAGIEKRAVSAGATRRSVSRRGHTRRARAHPGASHRTPARPYTRVTSRESVPRTAPGSARPTRDSAAWRE